MRSTCAHMTAHEKNMGLVARADHSHGRSQVDSQEHGRPNSETTLEAQLNLACVEAPCRVQKGTMWPQVALKRATWKQTPHEWACAASGHPCIWWLAVSLLTAPAQKWVWEGSGRSCVWSLARSSGTAGLLHKRCVRLSARRGDRVERKESEYDQGGHGSV